MTLSPGFAAGSCAEKTFPPPSTRAVTPWGVRMRTASPCPDVQKDQLQLRRRPRPEPGRTQVTTASVAAAKKQSAGIWRAHGSGARPTKKATSDREVHGGGATSMNAQESEASRPARAVSNIGERARPPPPARRSAGRTHFRQRPRPNRRAPATKRRAIPPGFPAKPTTDSW